MWKDFLTQYFQEYDYPADGAQSLLESLEKALRSETLAPVLLGAVAEYESTAPEVSEQVSALMQRFHAAALETDLCPEATDLLFFLLCMKHLKQRYEDAKLPMAYYRGVADDLRAKLHECYALKGIWGTFVASWFNRWFSLGRFAIGRLQYECIPIPESYCPEGYAHLAGQPAVNVHIPSGRPLIRREIRDSMAAAAAFFAPKFPDGKVLFICHSWLLFPGHLEMLPESSGIRAFMEEFTVAGTYDDPTGHDLWRIFCTEETANIDALPQDTSLQRAYVRWLKSGKSVGGGIGIRYIQV